MLITIYYVIINKDKGTWFSDINLEDMLLDYWSDEEIRDYADVDTRKINGEKMFYRW